MALGDPYCTTAQLAAYLDIDDTDDDTLILSAVTAASEWVNNHCQRQFNKTTSASARVFASPGRSLSVDDFHTTTGLVIETDDADTGTYGTTWTTTDYVLEPFNGIEGSVTGFPYRRITPVASRFWPCASGRPRVRVTAQWGWIAVPESVVLATKVVAAFLFNLKDSPLGVASFADSGIIRVRDVPQAAMLLSDYRHPEKTGMFVA